jgi:hypothetical protein
MCYTTKGSKLPHPTLFLRLSLCELGATSAYDPVFRQSVSTEMLLLLLLLLSLQVLGGTLRAAAWLSLSPWS